MSKMGGSGSPENCFQIFCAIIVAFCNLFCRVLVTGTGTVIQMPVVPFLVTVVRTQSSNLRR